MSPFTALKSFFVPTHQGLPTVDDPFVEIDQQRIVASLRLVERGEERGRLNQPVNQNPGLDVVEYEIVNVIGNELNRAQISARTHSQAYENRLADLQLLHEVLHALRGVCRHPQARGPLEGRYRPVSAEPVPMSRRPA